MRRHPRNPRTARLPVDRWVARTLPSREGSRVGVNRLARVAVVSPETGPYDETEATSAMRVRSWAIER